LRNVVITVKLPESFPEISLDICFHPLWLWSAKNRMENVKMTHSTRLVRCEITSSLHHITIYHPKLNLTLLKNLPY
jgi:hypothetical protein